jgi:hypothetical protein
MTKSNTKPLRTGLPSSVTTGSSAPPAIETPKPSDVGNQVVEVDHRAMTMVPRPSARLRVYRWEPDPDVVLGWDLPTAVVRHIDGGCRLSETV